MTVPSKIIFALSVLSAVSPLSAQKEKTGRGTVIGVDLGARTVFLRPAEGCGAPWSGKLSFVAPPFPFPVFFNYGLTKFEYGHHNPADPSILSVANSIEYVCPDPAVGLTTRITVVGPFKPPIISPYIPIGSFPLLSLTDSVALLGSFVGVAGAADVENGVPILRPNDSFTFDTGNCRILDLGIPAEHFQCDYAGNIISAAVLTKAVDTELLAGAFVPVASVPGGPMRTYVNSAGGLRVEIWSFPFLRLAVKLNF